jgi:hypothetical protein
MNYRKKKKEQSEDQKSFSEGFKYGRKKSQSEREDDYLESLGMKDGGVAKKKLKKLAEKRMCPSCKKGKCGCK